MSYGIYGTMWYVYVVYVNMWTVDVNNYTGK